MDFSKIYDAVDQRRPLNLLSSFPVILEKEEQLEVMWFYFSYLKGEEEGSVLVSDICTTRDGEAITEQGAALKADVKWQQEEAPKMDEADYYEQLEALYEVFDAELMKELLKKAEQQPFLEIYEKVIAYLESLIAEEKKVLL